MSSGGAPANPTDIVGTVLRDARGSGAAYRLTRLLGTGGMGGVYAALDAEDRPCAIKLVAGNLAGTEGSARLGREAKLASDLDSPHLVRVLDSGHDAEHNLPFLVMPLLEGRDLASLLSEVGTLAPETAVRIARQACAGLATAHAAGIMHRDVKPSNIFLRTLPDGEVIVTLCDFGIAKRFELYDDTRLTWTGRFLGSPAYMSPEQAKSSKHVDERTDIWSLGVTLYEMLCGEHLLGTLTNLPALLIGVCSRNAPPIQDRAPWIDPGLAVSLHRALRRDREARWPTIAAFGASLSPFCGEGTRLSIDALRPISPEVRRLVAPRADLAVLSESENAGDPGSGAPEADPLLGRDLAGRYDIHRALGRGGMGAVYEAIDRKGGRVAIKVIARRLVGENDDSVRRFLREAGAAASIASPHVVKVIEANRDAELDVPFIVMELLDGIDCATLFKRHAPIEPEPLVRLILQAGRGIAAAHARGIVHRDIKPANLFLHVEERGTGAGGRITVKVCDFGIAKLIGGTDAADDGAGDLSTTGKMIGSPMYMSPEQARNAKHVDHRTDLWSLAISLYEGLTGRRAWHGQTALGEIILAICTENVPPVRDLAPWVEPGLAEVVHRGLARDPDQRWSTMEEMLAALEPYAGTKIELTREELRSVSVARQPLAPPRQTLVSASASTTDAGTHASSEPLSSPRPRKSRSVLLVGGGAALAGGALLALLVTRGPSATNVASGNEAAVPSGDLHAKPARVMIKPPGALVRVNGQVVDIVDGAALLRGKPGDAFKIVVNHAGAEKTADVAITNAGEAVPSSVEVDPTPPVLTASASSPNVDDGRTTRGDPPKGPATGRPANPGLPAPATTAPKPPAIPAEDPLRPPSRW